MQSLEQFLHPTAGDKVSAIPKMCRDYLFLSKRTGEVWAKPEETGLGGLRSSVPVKRVAGRVSNEENSSLARCARSSNPAGEVKGSTAPRSTQGHLLEGRFKQQRLVNRGNYLFWQPHKDFLAEFPVTGKWLLRNRLLIKYAQTIGRAHHQLKLEQKARLCTNSSAATWGL